MPSLRLTLFVISFLHSAVVFSETSPIHAAFGPINRLARVTECVNDEKEYTNLRVGPRADLLNELVETLETEFNLLRKMADPKISDEKIAQGIIDSSPETFYLIFRNRLSFKETEELFKRWNDKFLHGASKTSLGKADFKRNLAQAFTNTYEFPFLIDKVARFKKALLDESAIREQMIRNRINGENIDIKKIELSITKSENLQRDLNDFKNNSAVSAWLERKK